MVAGTGRSSLREIKHARTKLGLMNAFVERLKDSDFDDISVRQICRDAEVAEKTFFNYFPEKISVVDYYIQLRTLRTVFLARKALSGGKYLDLIDRVFSRMGEELNDSDVIYQIISVLLIRGPHRANVDVGAFEKQLAFPDCKGIEELPAIRLEDWIRECVAAARKNGELPLRTNIDDLVVSLITILTGTLLATRVQDTGKRDYHYMRQLRALWQGLGVRQKDK